MKLESFQTSRYQLDIEYDDVIAKISFADNYSNVAFADSTYRYSAVVECDGKIARLQNLKNPQLNEHRSDRGGRIVTIDGTLGDPESGFNIAVQHRFYFPEDDEFFEERIVLKNDGQRKISILGYRFGFRKLLGRSQKYGGKGLDIEDYRLVAVPFRTQADGLKHDYTLDDLYQGLYQKSGANTCSRCESLLMEHGRARSEGWAWTNGENGLLIVKYNPNMIEFSTLESQRIDDEIYLNFGGAAPCLYDEPTDANMLDVGSELAFGKTRYYFYEGLWRRGYYMFRDYLSSLGHGIPDNYDPPVYFHSNMSENAEIAEAQAKLAVHLGCEGLMLGHDWETAIGSTIWDESKFGKCSELIGKLKNQYNLKTGLCVFGRSYSDSYPKLYRRTLDGRIGYCGAYEGEPFYEPCYNSRKYEVEKTRRISALTESGIDFLSFRMFDWRGPCMDIAHEHLVPTTPAIHSEAVIGLMAKVREKHPNLLIEAEDTVWPNGVRYLPSYYLHDSGGTYDELAAFGFEDEPLDNLISGKALSLFYYNLAYDIPLSLCINMDQDNDNALAFWWYASTIRHLGVASWNADEKRIALYKKSIEEYKSLKQIFAIGSFYGLDELTHLHVLPEADMCVVNAFNLTDTPVSREVSFRTSDVGILDELCSDCKDHRVEKGKVILKLDIPAFSPMLIKLRFKSG